MSEKIIGNEKNILFYNDEEGNVQIEVLLENEDVWLNTEALAKLFNIDRSGITKHINNIYRDDELNENSTSAKIAHMGNDGKQNYNTKYYNLDMIISIGFRVNSKKAIKFRTWANKIIKDYMVQGFALNAERNIPMYMNDWKNEVENALKVFHYEVLEGKGKISHKQAIDKAESEYEKYKVIQDKNYISDFDKLLNETKAIENK